MSEDRAVYGDVQPAHPPAVGEAWEAYLQASAGGATSPYEFFHAGFTAGLAVCTRPCCAQIALLDLEQKP